MWVQLSPSLLSKLKGFRTYMTALIMGSGGTLLVLFDTFDSNVDWKGWLYEHTKFAGLIVIGFSLIFAYLRHSTTQALYAEINPPEPPGVPEVPEIEEPK